MNVEKIKQCEADDVQLFLFNMNKKWRSVYVTELSKWNYSASS